MCVILRYLTLIEIYQKPVHKINERILEFVHCDQKSGGVIAELVKTTLKRMINILIVGDRSTVTDQIIQENLLTLFSACTCHTLNLCAVEAAGNFLKAVICLHCISNNVVIVDRECTTIRITYSMIKDNHS
ncbi:hypothetical protein PR048_001843 [Dryococelus australis]|uniref:DUF659 domain-containing protein n=1 Tax=Dryococelus australis TaxID=614101 RepID=A0ABQ9IJV6_9NEOP|nr:hypothetical protein PR048_001843 [Dryococelus australis]